MVSKKDFKKITDYLWEIPKSFRADMRVPARLYVSGKLLEKIEPDAIKQIINVASLPGIVKYSLAMPDAHTGYGFVIGGVAATRYPEGVISPGGVGYDISCSIRLLKSEYTEKEIKPYLEKLATEIQGEVPSGLGRGRKIKLSIEEIDKILEGGVPYLVEKGYGEKEDIENCEEKGRMIEADASCVSERAKMRGRDQVGTLGSGNHFCSIEKIEEVFDEKIAEVFGLFKDQIVVMVHCGSRGLGHQIATDYIRIMMQAMLKYRIKLPDRELACVPFNSSEGQRYFKAMCAGANYSWSNKHMITHYIRKVWQSVLGKGGLKLLYDVAHNIAKVEEHEVDGKKMKLIVHRKGATRAFPPGHPEIPEKYRETGQPAILPGSMGTPSYVLAGIEESKEAWHTVAHGAGRAMSRHAAMRAVRGEEVIRRLKEKGILVKCRSIRGIAEEAPLAYKDVNEVVEVVHNAGLSRKVAKLVPLAVIKGE
ncbi:MAG: RtcB family protein [Candidatus Nealsonbacteria bacterium]